ncbi:hypothetical protein BZG36_05190 [Bifiguratus adelaidae]|uniref:REJ domain-containing protein n=1 Tax=Bifiguratus adelaidae TaxID=1938954 RepID=A0A261XTW0_9FUNG|nr:hypothetical protein BZG36_05190 [Bifiguratus adelaidae]
MSATPSSGGSRSDTGSSSITSQTGSSSDPSSTTPPPSSSSGSTSASVTPSISSASSSSSNSLSPPASSMTSETSSNTAKTTTSVSVSSSVSTSISSYTSMLTTGGNVVTVTGTIAVVQTSSVPILAANNGASSSGAQINKSAIIGGTVGGVAAIAIVAIAAWALLVRRRTQRRDALNATLQDMYDPGSDTTTAYDRPVSGSIMTDVNKRSLVPASTTQSWVTSGQGDPLPEYGYTFADGAGAMPPLVGVRNSYVSSSAETGTRASMQFLPPLSAHSEAGSSGMDDAYWLGPERPNEEEYRQKPDQRDAV